MNRAELERRFAGHLTVPLATATPVLGIGVALARQEAKEHGQVLGVRVLRAGRVWRVPVVDLIALAPDMPAAGPIPGPAAESAVSTAPATHESPTEAPDGNNGTTTHRD